MNKCRLCLAEGTFLTSVTEKREGLPISVIIMIICPVKIEDDDLLPKEVCGDCLDVVLSAYKLREKSARSEIILREKVNNMTLKREIQRVETDGNSIIRIDHSRVSPFIDCSKDVNSKSFDIWEYFGKIKDASDQTFEDNLYCKLCYSNKEFTKYSKTAQKSSFLKHLSKAHNMKLIQHEPTVSQDQYNCDLCRYKSQDKLKIDTHMLRNHLNKPSATESSVSSKKKDSRSSVWNYFDKISDKKEDSKEFFICKVCTDSGFFLTAKYSASCPTSSLILHLEKAHEIKIDTRARKKRQLKKETVYSGSCYGVNCHKAAENGSTAWNFFGSLVDLYDTPVEAETEFWFCKLCFQNDHMRKFKKTTSTFNLLQHVKKFHDEEVVDVSQTEPSNIQIPKVENSHRTCSLCNETLTSRQSYYIHMRERHADIEPSKFICHVCSKSFAKNYVLLAHMKLHEGIIYNCPKCPATFSYPKGLKRHLIIHEPDHLSKFQCDQCTNSYAGIKSLRNHILQIHMQNQPKQRSHPCLHCDMSFFKRQHLLKHMMKHTGEKPHECQFCNKAYASKGDLMRHLQRSHVGDALYSCTVDSCNESFRLQVQLREHYKIHYQDNKL